MNAGTLYVAIKGDTKDLVTALKNAQNASISYGKGAKQAITPVQSAVESLQRNVLALGAAWMGTQGIKAIVGIADQYALLDSKIKLVSGSSTEFKATYAELFRISQETGSSFASNASNYANLSLALKDTNYTSKETLALFDSVNKSLVVAGATTAEASSFMLQFRQAMGSGKLAGDEFRGMMESNSYWGGQLAKALDTDVSGLRQMSKDGKLTTDVLMKAFPEMSAQIEKDFSGIEKTIARSMVELSNAFNDVVADANRTTGGTASIAEAVSELATTITENKEAISSLFAGVIKSAEIAVERVVNFANSIQVLRLALHSDQVSMFDWIGGDPEAMRKILDEFGNGTSQARSLLAQVRTEIKETQDQWGLWSDKKGTLEELRKEEAELVVWLEKGNQAVVDSASSLENLHENREKAGSALLSGLKKNSKEVTELTKQQIKEREKIRKDNLAYELKLSKDAAKGATDSWLVSAQLREKALEDLEDAENKIISDREKLYEDTSKDLKRLTMSERDYRKDALEDEYRERVKLAGNDKKLQDELTHWKVAKLQEIETETGHSLIGMLGDWQKFTDGVGDDFGQFTTDLITGEFDSLEDAWDGLWKAMLGTAAQYLGNIVAEFAAAKIADFATDLFFSHSGTWDVKNDEKKAVLLKGQMVLPEDVSEQIRQTFPNPNGDFSGLSEALGRSGYTSGVPGAVGFNAGMKTLTKTALMGLMGMSPTMGGAAKGFSMDAMAQGFSGLVGDALGISADTGPFGGSAYSSGGRKMGKSLGIATFGPTIGAALASITGAVGGFLGDSLGDALNDRSYEGLRDAMEDGYMTSQEAIGFARAADYAGVDNTSKLGSAIGAVSDAIGRAKDAAFGAIKDLAEAMGFGGSQTYGGDGGFGSDAAGFGGNTDGGGDMGRGGFGADGDMGMGGEGFAHTGGFLLKADEGRIIAQTGEGVLSRPGMKNLDRLNTGKLGGGDNEGMLLALQAIAINTSKMAKILQRFEYTGIPQNNTVGVAS